MTIAQLIEIIINNDKHSQTTDGHDLYRMFRPTDRYVVDFADDFKTSGWAQYDTDQDAHYFGVWVNGKSRQVLTYAEGDWTLNVAPDVDAFNREIRRMNEFYGEGFVFKALDVEHNAMTTFVQDRNSFFASDDTNPQPLTS